jgi:hypothetical protein
VSHGHDPSSGPHKDPVRNEATVRTLAQRGHVPKLSAQSLGGLVGKVKEVLGERVHIETIRGDDVRRASAGRQLPA